MAASDVLVGYYEELKGGRAGGTDSTRSSDGLWKLRRTHDMTMRRTAQCMRSMCCRLICGDQQIVATWGDQDAWDNHWTRNSKPQSTFLSGTSDIHYGIIHENADRRQKGRKSEWRGERYRFQEEQKKNEVCRRRRERMKDHKTLPRELIGKTGVRLEG